MLSIIILDKYNIDLLQIFEFVRKRFIRIVLVLIHIENWGVSFNQISKSFYHTKNRNAIKNHYKELISKGYLKEDVDTYYIILTQIQKDYEDFLIKVCLSSHFNGGCWVPFSCQLGTKCKSASSQYLPDRYVSS